MHKLPFFHIGRSYSLEHLPIFDILFGLFKNDGFRHIFLNWFFIQNYNGELQL